MSYHTFSSPPCGPTCIQGATFGNMLIGGLGLLINCIIALTLTVLLSRPIATLLGQILFLTWLFAVRVENSNIGLIVHYLDWTQILLTPVVVCANIGTGTLNWYNAAMILVAIGYIGMLTMMAQLFFQGAISSYIDAFVTFLEGGLRC